MVLKSDTTGMCKEKIDLKSLKPVWEKKKVHVNDGNVYLPKISKYLKKRKSNDSGDENIKNWIWLFYYTQKKVR